MKIKKFYSDDVIKKLWRQKITGFIQKNLPQEESDKLKVLCLPGHEMLEIFEIYDSLGIKRNNIIGIEGNPLVFEELEKKNNLLEEKIDLVNSSLREYVENNKNQKFDIISLDCTGYFNSEKEKILKIMSHEKMIGESPIIITNYPLGRTNSYLDKIPRSNWVNDIVNLFKNKQNINHSEEYDLFQDKAIQLNPIEGLLEGEGIWNSGVFKKWEYEKLNSLSKTTQKRFKEIIKSLRGGDDYSDELVNYLFFSKENNLLKNVNLKDFINSLNPYMLKNHESYQYQSESGSVLLSDFYSFNRFSGDNYLNRVSKILKEIPKKRIVLND